MSIFPEKKLGFGLMRLNTKDGKPDFEHTCKMVDEYMEAGFNYFDTAYVYLGGQSEVAFRECVVNRYDREKFCIADKLPFWDFTCEEDCDKAFEEQKQRCGVDYFDYYLIHNIDGESFEKTEKLKIWQWCQKQKKLGTIKYFGFSMHDKADVLDKILTKYPFVDFVQLQINYADWESERVQSRKCYETARKHGKEIIVMEPVKGGLLAQFSGEVAQKYEQTFNNRSAASLAIKFAASLDGVKMVLSGMNTMQQLQDNINTMLGEHKLTQQEQSFIQYITDEMAKVPTVPCTNCKYCVDDCPMKIEIPNLIRVHNLLLQFKDKSSLKGHYTMATSSGAKAGNCIACGKCEDTCPQHLNIIQTLEKVAENFEK